MVTTTRRKFLLVAVAILLAISIPSGYLLLSSNSQTQSVCPSIFGGAKVMEKQLSSVHFDAITKFALPLPTRNPNGIVAAPDGSVWFGEQGLAGVGHLFLNGTLREYSWLNQNSRFPQANSCSRKAGIGGLALWEGKVWASDSTSNAIVGLDPSSLSVQVVKLPHNDSYPYTLAVGPDHSLWFTELRAFTIARLDSGGRIQEYKLPKYVVPTELAFVNATLGYYTDPGIAGFGSVFSFNPSNFTSQRIGGAIVLFGPDSVAVGNGGIWLAEHGGSDVGFYDIAKSAWTIYPTSNSQITDLTLPFYVRVNDTKVWFNEQFADRMGVIDAANNSMTEYPFSRPGASNLTQIGDVQTIVLSGSRVWFTESAHNSVGYLDSSYQPTFSVAVSDSSVSLGKGAQANVTLSIVNHSSKPLSFQFADTETRIGRNQNITLVNRPSFIPSSDVSQHIALTIRLVGNLAPGNYLVAITVTDGVIFRSTFIAVNVLP